GHAPRAPGGPHGRPGRVRAPRRAGAGPGALRGAPGPGVPQAARAARALVAPGLVRPPPLEHLGVLVLRVGRAEGEHLGAVGAALHAAGEAGADAHGVPGAELEDVVLELDPGVAVDDDVDLLLLGVAVAEGDAVARRDLEVAQARVLELQRLAGEAR